MKQGGLVPDASLAQALAALPENRGRKIVPGEPFQMEPCMPQELLDDPTSYWQEQGRPCPFIELDSRNEKALSLVLSALPEHTRPLVPALADALLADLSAEDRAKTLQRVSLTLRSDPVVRKLYPHTGEEK